MSVDLHGKCPHNPAANWKGTTLSMSWWVWRPLAVYCFTVAPKLCEGSHHVVRWQSNDGRMEASEALELGSIIQGEIDSGRAKRFCQQYVRDQENLPDVVCTLCLGTGKRRHIQDAATLLECNSCDGYGTRRPDACNYSLHLDSIRTLAKFLIHSGGFEVR